MARELGAEVWAWVADMAKERQLEASEPAAAAAAAPAAGTEVAAVLAQATTCSASSMTATKEAEVLMVAIVMTMPPLMSMVAEAAMPARVFTHTPTPY
jgi:hypothetical protein